MMHYTIWVEPRMGFYLDLNANTQDEALQLAAKSDVPMNMSVVSVSPV